MANLNPSWPFACIGAYHSSAGQSSDDYLKGLESPPPCSCRVKQGPVPYAPCRKAGCPQNAFRGDVRKRPVPTPLLPFDLCSPTAESRRDANDTFTSIGDAFFGVGVRAMNCRCQTSLRQYICLVGTQNGNHELVDIMQRLLPRPFTHPRSPVYHCIEISKVGKSGEGGAPELCRRRQEKLFSSASHRCFFYRNFG